MRDAFGVEIGKLYSEHRRATPGEEKYRPKGRAKGIKGFFGVKEPIKGPLYANRTDDMTYNERPYYTVGVQGPSKPVRQFSIGKKPTTPVSKRDTTKRHNEAITSAQGGVATMGAGAAGGAFLIGEGQRQRAKEFKVESRRTRNKAHKTIQAANNNYADYRKRLTQAVVTDYHRGHDPKMLKIQGKYLHDRAKVARDFGNKRGFMLVDDSERAAKAAKTAIARGKVANKVAIGVGGASLAGVAALQTRRKKEKVVKDAFGVERISKSVERGLEMVGSQQGYAKPPKKRYEAEVVGVNGKMTGIKVRGKAKNERLLGATAKAKHQAKLQANAATSRRVAREQSIRNDAEGYW